MDNNQMQTANHIIEYLKEIDADGETIEYILREIGMDEQLFKQLFMQANDYDINYYMKERELIHDQGKNKHFNQ